MVNPVVAVDGEGREDVVFVAAVAGRSRAPVVVSMVKSLGCSVLPIPCPIRPPSRLQIEYYHEDMPMNDTTYL